jgi:hypothetical protein
VFIFSRLHCIVSQKMVALHDHRCKNLKCATWIFFRFLNFNFRLDRLRYAVAGPDKWLSVIFVTSRLEVEAPTAGEPFLWPQQLNQCQHLPPHAEVSERTPIILLSFLPRLACHRTCPLNDVAFCEVHCVYVAFISIQMMCRKTKPTDRLYFLIRSHVCSTTLLKIYFSGALARDVRHSLKRK